MRFIVLQAATESDSFFDSPWVKFATRMTWAVLAAMWLALVFWTYKDAKRRLTDPLMIGVAVAAALIFPFLGALFYAILRPPEYLEDVLERDLEIRARELQLEESGGAGRCPACRTAVRNDFVVCPKCRRRLKEKCASCSRPLDPDWKVCPYCEQEAREAGGGARTRKLVAEEFETSS